MKAAPVTAADLRKMLERVPGDFVVAIQQHDPDKGMVFCPIFECWPDRAAARYCLSVDSTITLPSAPQGPRWCPPCRSFPMGSPAFCDLCGKATLPWPACASCGTVNSPLAKFCGKCGTTQEVKA